MWYREVKWGSEKPWKVGSRLCGERAEEKGKEEECSIPGSCKKSYPPKVAVEKGRERVNTRVGD